MNAPALDWVSIIDHRSPKFLVKGHELAQALYGPCKRFAIVEVRCLEADGYCGVRYRVRDAEAVSDAEVKAGLRPRVIGDGMSFEEAIILCQGLAPAQDN